MQAPVATGAVAGGFGGGSPGTWVDFGAPEPAPQPYFAAGPPVIGAAFAPARAGAGYPASWGPPVYAGALRAPMPESPTLLQAEDLTCRLPVVNRSVIESLHYSILWDG